MTRHELDFQDIPERKHPLLERILRTGPGEDIRRRIYERELPGRFQDYARIVMPWENGHWPTHPPQPFTLLDFVSLNTQAEQQASLYGPNASEQMQTYDQIGKVVNHFASEARKKLAARIPFAELHPLEATAHELWKWGSQYIRESIILQENDMLMTLPERILQNEKAQRKGIGQRGAHALQKGGPYMARQAIAHAVQHVLVGAGVVAETAVTGGAGFILRFTIGQLGLHTVNTAIDALRKSPLDGVVFDQGSLAEITRDGPELEKAYRDFLLEARKYKVKITIEKGKKRKPTEVLIAPEKKPFYVADALQTAQAIYYNQSPMDFARGPHAHWSAAYLGLRLGEWENNYQDLLR